MVFADSSGFIAAFDPRDGAHAKAAAAWRQIAKAGERLVTTQLVLAETVTYLRRRGGWERSRRAGAADPGEPADRGASASNAEQLAAAWREFVRNPDPEAVAVRRGVVHRHARPARCGGRSRSTAAPATPGSRSHR